MPKRHPLKVIKDLGKVLPEDECKTLHRRLAYLYRIASDNQDWKMLGTIRGICAQLELYEALLNSCGYRLPPKRRCKPKVAEGQLGLFAPTKVPS